MENVTAIKQIEILQIVKDSLYFNPEWLTDNKNFEHYRTEEKEHNFNYIIDINKDIVYFVPNKENGCLPGIFGNKQHFFKYYQFNNK